MLLEAQGIVTVSRDNERFLLEMGIVPKKRVRYLPNGFDGRRFVPLNRVECRRTLGLPADGWIAAFAGAFIERKGPLRVLHALEQSERRQGRVSGTRPPMAPWQARVARRSGPQFGSSEVAVGG